VNITAIQLCNTGAASRRRSAQRDAKEAVVNITTTQLRNTRAESGRRSTLSYAKEAVVHNATTPQTKLGKYLLREKKGITNFKRRLHDAEDKNGNTTA